MSTPDPFDPDFPDEPDFPYEPDFPDEPDLPEPPEPEIEHVYFVEEVETDFEPPHHEW